MTNKEKYMADFKQTASLVEEHSNKLKKGMQDLTNEVDGLVIPEKWWNDAQKVKTNIRKLAVKIEQFVLAEKTALASTVRAKTDKNIYDWITGIDVSLNSILEKLHAL